VKYTMSEPPLLEYGTVALAPQQVAQPTEALLRTWRTATIFMYLVRTLGAFSFVIIKALLRVVFCLIVISPAL